MRVLRIYYLLPPIKGGMEKHIYYLSKLQNEEIQVSVFFNQGDAISSFDKKVCSIIKLYKIRPLFLGIFFFYICIILNLLLRSRKFDVIHIHGDWSSLVFVSLLKKITGAKIGVYTNHGSITNKFQHKKILPITLRKVDLIFTTGYESGEILRKLISKEVFVQPSGINSVFFESLPESLVSHNENFQVVTVANLVPVKNLFFVLEIAEKLPHVKFIIVGDGPEKENISSKILLNDINNIDLVGFKTAEEIRTLYDTSDCFLLTSIAEGTPTSVLEAMARGLPIVSSNAGGLNNIIVNGSNGLIVENFDKVKFIESIERIKNDVDLRKVMSKNNKVLAQSYRWENVAKRITRLTKECFYEEN